MLCTHTTSFLYSFFFFSVCVSVCYFFWKKNLWCFVNLKNWNLFILQRLIKESYNLYLYFSLARMLARGGDQCARKPLHTEKTYMSNRATTKPFHIQLRSIMGIELGSQRWEPSALFTTLLRHPLKCLSESNPIMLDFIEDGTSRNI